MDQITIRYSTIDGVNDRRAYKTLDAARRFAWKMVGEHPEIGMFYAVSSDGIGKIECEGCALRDVFPDLTIDRPYSPDAAGYRITRNDADDCYQVTFNGRDLAACGTREEAETYLADCQEYDRQCAGGNVG